MNLQFPTQTAAPRAEVTPPLQSRVMALITARGPLTLAQIAAHLPDVSPTALETCLGALTRRPNARWLPRLERFSGRYGLRDQFKAINDDRHMPKPSISRGLQTTAAEMLQVLESERTRLENARERHRNRKRTDANDEAIVLINEEIQAVRLCAKVIRRLCEEGRAGNAQPNGKSI